MKYFNVVFSPSGPPYFRLRLSWFHPQPQKKMLFFSFVNFFQERFIILHVMM